MNYFKGYPNTMTFRSFSQSFGMKGNVWGVKYHKAEPGKQIYRIFVPKDIEKVILNI